MSTTTLTNGKPARKQLADQLDRLDALIDVLGDGLNAAVADACKEGARAAVREVLMELISNPDLLSAVRPAVPVAQVPNDDPPVPPAKHTPVPTPQSFWARVKAGAASVKNSVSGAARTLTQSIAGAVKPAADALKLTGTSRTVVAVALGAGLTAGAVSLISPTWVGAVLSAGAGMAAVAAAHVGAKLNRLFAALRVT